MTNADKRPTTRRNLGRGLSIPAAAEELYWPEWSLRRAVDRKEVKVFNMAGLRRIPPAEIARLKELSGK
jgi:hypothetical protein